MAMVLTTQKPTRRNRYGKVPEDLPGSTLERGMRERKRQELGRSFRFLIQRKWVGRRPQGIRILSHGRGNPETEAGRSLNGRRKAMEAGGR